MICRSPEEASSHRLGKGNRTGTTSMTGRAAVLQHAPCLREIASCVKKKNGGVSERGGAADESHKNRDRGL
ncbi:hypothetical protein SESBI_31708 [Sesbania bispinosa]|nr:hypothetical protein SESBI_31708 [Sesbania bispinosa]